MRALQRNNIVDVFVWVDDVAASYPKPIKPGVRSNLTDSELATILIWDGLTEPHKTLRSVYNWIAREYSDCFPKLPRYQNFVAHTHRVLPLLGWLLKATLSTASSLRFVDSTMLPVCRLIRAGRHKVAQGVATFGKNHQGWWFGFKLHASIDHSGRLAAVWFTGANEADVLQLKHLVNQATNIVVGDAGYTAKVTRRHLWRDYRCMVISPARWRRQVDFGLQAYGLKAFQSLTGNARMTSLKPQTGIRRGERLLANEKLASHLGTVFDSLGFVKPSSFVNIDHSDLHGLIALVGAIQTRNGRSVPCMVDTTYAHHIPASEPTGPVMVPARFTPLASLWPLLVMVVV